MSATLQNCKIKYNKRATESERIEHFYEIYIFLIRKSEKDVIFIIDIRQVYLGYKRSLAKRSCFCISQIWGGA